MVTQPSEPLQIGAQPSHLRAYPPLIPSHPGVTCHIPFSAGKECPWKDEVLNFDHIGNAILLIFKVLFPDYWLSE